MLALLAALRFDSVIFDAHYPARTRERNANQRRTGGDDARPGLNTLRRERAKRFPAFGGAPAMTALSDPDELMHASNPGITAANEGVGRTFGSTQAVDRAAAEEGVQRQLHVFVDRREVRLFLWTGG